MPNFWHVSYKLIGKHFSVFFRCFPLHFREITYIKNIKFTSGFICCSFVEGESKEAFCFSNVFLHTLFFENEEKISE